MQFDMIAARVGCANANGRAIEFNAVTEDSRRVTPGALFVAVAGARADGHDFAPAAKARGAVAILGEREGMDEFAGLPYLRVPHSRRALAIIAHELRGNPTRQLTVIGITGTNGKTSTAYLVRSVLTAAGRPTAYFGTLGYDIGQSRQSAPHTTPFGEDLAELMARARESGVTHVVMEASSHAIEQERIAGIDFRAAVFTNLTQDHLDYHANMERYLAAKLKLFEQIEGEGRFTVVNRDDPSAQRFIDASRVPCYTFGKKADCRASHVRHGPDHTTFTLSTPWGKTDVHLALLGAHNVANALAAAAVCGPLGVDLDTIAKGLANLPSVPGRFEHVRAGQDFQVIVDYAHTEDGLRNVLHAARKICKGRVILVFGCGGDRDRGKRPRMGAAAADLADYAIVTSDNPRTEDPERILLDIETGLQHAGKKKQDDYLVLIDRRTAIETAINLAQPGDLVLIAGKGHEDYQIIGENRIHFDDRETARDILEKRRPS